MLKRLILPLSALVFTAHAQTVVVKPYLQPGDGASLTGTDSKVLTWLTDQKPGEFTVEFGAAGRPMQQAKITRLALDFDPPKPKPATPAKAPEPAKKPAPSAAEDKDHKEPPVIIREVPQHYLRYRAELPGLPFDSEISYRVKLGASIVRGGSFKTRATATKPVRFVAVGDMASAKPEQNTIAFRIAQQKPEFLIALGDIVYPGGRLLQYTHHFWNVYNDVPTPGEKTGAPLMASVPFYAVLGNHDTDNTKLPDYPDAYAAFYAFTAPKNGPSPAVSTTPLGSNAAVAEAFRKRAGAEYPALNAYSFDYGPAHIVSIDSNRYTDPRALIPWLEKDLMATNQPWKFVCFHHPGFHSSSQHGDEQHMRLLSPTFEKCGVNVVFAGHVHNYQRSKPLRFAPDPAKSETRPIKVVDGQFTFDERFDGAATTKPEGIIYLVSGGGGATLYKPKSDKKGAKPDSKSAEKKASDTPFRPKPFTAKFNADVHSFSVVDLTPTTFELRQISISGDEIDRFKITK